MKWEKHRKAQKTSKKKTYQMDTLEIKSYLSQQKTNKYRESLVNTLKTDIQRSWKI
jgi:hypothetical protein